MNRREAFEGAQAAAEAAKMANIDFIAAYPITPQSHISEALAEMVANGELNAAYVPVESEHSAMSACLGAAAVGARTFTATAGPGLELMHEVVYVASSMRYPIVMAVCNRALSAPLSVWGDHSDVMAVRDVGWIQVFAENSQQVFDLILWAFRVGEDPKVLFPVMVHLDGFTVSHVTESVMIPTVADVARFLPEYRYPFALHPDNPITHGAFGLPNIYSEVKLAQEKALRNSMEVIVQGWKEFGDVFGRYYSPVEQYQTEGAKTLLLTVGAFTETSKIVIDDLRSRGEDVGLISLRLWRPFPFKEFLQAVKDAETLIVFDRSISYGGPGGPVFSEVKSALYHEKKRPNIVNFVGGLGGRDVSVNEFKYVIDKGRQIAKEGSDEIFFTVGIRGQ